MNAAQRQLWRRWAPFGLFLVAPVVGLLVDLLVSGPRGHWSGHLGGGAAAAGEVLGAGVVLEGVGTKRVAASIWQTSYGDEQAAAIGPSFEGFESGHALAGTGDMLVVLGGLAFAG